MGAALKWSIFVSLFFIVSQGPSMTSSQITCPEGFSNINDRCFQFVIDQPNTWYAAEDTCESLGGYLAVLDSCNVLKEVVKRINAQGMQDLNFWIGATDIAEEDTWLWVTGASVEMGMPFWGGQSATPEPDGDHTVNCANLYQGSRHYLGDGFCTDIWPFLCQVGTNLAPPSDNITAGPASLNASCPEGFTNISDRCFQFVMDEGMNWYVAQDKCEEIGGYLAVLNDCDLLKDVVRRIHAQGMHTINFWIGATDIAEEDNWLWLSGDSVEMGMPFWGYDSGSTQPSGDNSYDCVYLESYNRHYMHSASCTTGKARAICQVDPIIVS